MGQEAAVINVLRAGKRCKPVKIGKVHMYHFWRHKPAKGAINVAWIKDNRALQFAQAGYLNDYLDEAKRYLELDRQMFSYCNAFIAPTATFAEEVMRWYGAQRPWFHFANYPYKTAVQGAKREEIVYVDYSTTVFQRELYLKLFAFFDELRALTGYDGVLVSNIFHRQIDALPHNQHIRVLRVEDYDYRSRFGILVNLTNFRGAVEALPRKLLLYLHCGMWPLIHGTFAESVYYCRRNGVKPLIYWDTKDAMRLIQAAKSARWKRDRFCIEERIGDLMGYLRKLGR